MFRMVLRAAIFDDGHRVINRAIFEKGHAIRRRMMEWRVEVDVQRMYL